MTAPDDLHLLRAWAKLRHRAFAHHPEFRPGAAADDRIRSAVGHALCKARIDGDLHALWDDGRLRAVVACYAEPGSWYGAPVTTVTLDLDPDDTAAVGWTLGRVRPLAEPDDVDIWLPAHYRRLLPPLLDMGLGIDSLILLGEPVTALDRLVRFTDPPALGALGLEVGRFSSVAEVDRVVALKRTAFTAHPEWCWFGATPAALARDRADWLLALETPSPDDPSFVVRRDGELVGFVGLRIDPTNPLWGPVAGMDLVVAPAERGRGLAKSLYREGLSRLVAAGAQVFKGGTSQPAVLGLGRTMGRPLHAAMLRRKTRFGPEHFRAYI